MNKLIVMIDSDHCFTPQKSLSLLLVLLLLPWQLPAQAQKVQLPRSSGLKIYTLQGNGAVNFIPDGRAVTPVVEIRDENELPVGGAIVEFTLPESGPGGDFPNGQHVVKATTNTAGQAQAPFTVRPQPGTFKIQVVARIDTRSAVAVISQTNTLKMSEAATTIGKKRAWYKNWKILLPIGAGVAIVAILLATRSGGSSATSSIPTVGLTPGIPTYGAPH